MVTYGEGGLQKIPNPRVALNKCILFKNFLKLLVSHFYPVEKSTVSEYLVELNPEFIDELSENEKLK